MSNSSELIEELKTHNKVYNKVNSQLNALFENYSNKGAIITLFEYWVLTFRLVYCAYGANGLRAYLNSKYKDPLDFSYNYEIGRKTDLVIQSKKINSKFLFRFLDSMPLNLRFPGSPKTLLFDRLRARYTSLIVRSIPIKKDKILEKKIKDILNLYLLEAGVSENIDVDEINGIPNIFISKQNSGIHSKILSIRCAPVELMHFNGNEDILLKNNKLEIFGYQHGGGYDNFDLDVILSFEKKLSTIFYGWGFSHHNIHQTRYSRKNTFSPKTAKKNRVIWVETPKDTKLIAYYYPVAVTERTDINVVPYIFKELNQSGITYFNKPYNDALRSDRYDGKRGIVFDGNENAEDLIEQGDLIIFDNCMHSLIYSCIENDILFIIVSNESLKRHYTAEMKKWFEILRSNRLFFFPNEIKFLSNRICELSSNYIMPQEVVEYHHKKFINI